MKPRTLAEKMRDNRTAEELDGFRDQMLTDGTLTAELQHQYLELRRSLLRT